MSRNYYINGQCLVLVRGSASNVPLAQEDGAELGLTDGQGVVTITPNFYHVDYKYDEYGTNVPPDVFWNLTDVVITFRLVHFDQEILRACMTESAGGKTDASPEGTMKGNMQSMGAGKAMYDQKNHYMTLYLSSPGNAGLPWRFKACYMPKNPVVWPLSAERSLVDCVWRAIPYVPVPSEPGGELVSAGVTVWDHQAMSAAFTKPPN